MNATGSAHGPFKSTATEDPQEVESRQRLHCRFRSSRCLREAGDRGWQAFACVTPTGEHCQAYERAPLADLQQESTELAALAMWILETEDSQAGRGYAVEHPDLETMRADRRESTKRRGL